MNTGAPPSLRVVKESIEKHGFAVADIDHIFVTHCEHPDHAGDVGALSENAGPTTSVRASSPPSSRRWRS